MGVVLAIGLAIGLPPAVGSGAASAHGVSSRHGSLGPEGPPLERGPILARPGSPSLGHSVHGIACQRGEQTLIHIHARLTIFVHGHSRRVPAGIGISHPLAEPTGRGAFVVAGVCFAWLHTHAADGIIHIESPVRRTCTLGNFFDVWGQPLSKSRVGPARGPVTAYLDGRVWHGNPRSIRLTAHAQIQLEVGRPLVAPVLIKNWYGL